jgi:hypothetical protein
MPEELETELICCAQRHIVCTQCGQAVRIVRRGWRVETRNFIVVDGMKLLILQT